MLISKKAKDLLAGDRCDLEGDEYADPARDKPALVSEFQVVQFIDLGFDGSVDVGFDGFDVVCYPQDHRVLVDVI